ncbi:MAG: FGGY family carbohydrate kinase [Acidimicrobiales bacterium]
MAVVVTIDAGTTGVRALAIDETAKVIAISYRELPQYYPRPGWVEHDPSEIFALVEETLGELSDDLERRDETIVALGLTNQRETAVAWDSHTGKPLHRAIVWQDRRTADRCRELEAAGHLELVRTRTGLVLDSYFSATKWEWMFRRGGVVPAPGLALGTVDAWLCWKLTGRHATDPTNASRTLCYDIAAHKWSTELCEMFGLDEAMLGEIVPSSGRIATIRDEVAGGRLAGLPLAGIAGDQQAALFGQSCLEQGQTKVTYGTGCFVLMNLGPDLPRPADGLLTTVAWQLSDRASDVAYALEGAIFSAGATIQWLRDGLGIIKHASDAAPLASTVTSSEGVYLVPAFTGLGSPWWDPQARTVIGGLTRGSNGGHIARAAIEAMAFQTRDVIDAMVSAGGCELSVLRVDGGAAVMDLLCQLLADQCQVPVVRRSTTEVTALGAGFLAGIAEGIWASDDVAGLVGEEARFEPTMTKNRADADHGRWLAALQRSRDWV